MLNTGINHRTELILFSTHWLYSALHSVADVVGILTGSWNRY